MRPINFLYIYLDRFFRWKPLEAALAVLGAESDALSDIVQAEADEGRPKPFDTDTLLGSVIPSLLGIHGLCCA
jgi:hypothetical protein